MKRLFLVLLLIFSFSAEISAENLDAPSELNLLFEDRTLNLNFELQPELLRREPVNFLTVDSVRIPLDTGAQLPTDYPDLFPIETEFITRISAEKLRQFFQDSAILKDLGDNAVEIHLKEADEIEFVGNPYYGFDIDFERLIDLVDTAIATRQNFVRVPAEKTFSPVVAHPDLQARGIREIIAIGESNFTGSSAARKQNILAGARKFDGQIVEKGKIFSFNDILESVEEKEGFVRELVIKGNKTEKELGGGVCQVSTTVFRAAFSGGLPIVRRRNHSYAVPYYKPFGLDAMIYLGQQDFRFKNDTPGDILIQTIVTEEDIFFVFYGTKDQREIVFEGPFISDYQSAPPPKVYETEDLPPNKVEYVSPAHAGFRAEWIRKVTKDDQTSSDTVTSTYRPWPATVRKGKD